MKPRFRSGNQIRTEFIEFFKARGHKFIHSASLVPGDDQTLLFTNAGMVQFKDIFLGTDHREYTRAVNSQKCMRVSGKHNDLEEVGSDNTHHTFFEMLGNWSFGDYYKKEAIAWAWELFAEVWELPPDQIYATCFEDEFNEIERDDEAYQYWLAQPGMKPEHILFFGRKDNFWEMADTGPCGPSSEIHLDRGVQYCEKQGIKDHKCSVSGDCSRFIELWNLVFIQYNRIDEKTLIPLPKKHVDTGLGFDRIVSVLQDVKSNYDTDLLKPIIEKFDSLASVPDPHPDEYIIASRVIADHIRATAFMIADGVIPGNTGRNYVCRMIIRRASRFGRKIGFEKPFLSELTDTVISIYQDFYPELGKNRAVILDQITQEEIRFRRTLDSGLARLTILLDELENQNEKIISGDDSFDLYATYGLPLEITRDIALERSIGVDEAGFQQALNLHKKTSRKGDRFRTGNTGELEVYKKLNDRVTQSNQELEYDPYGELEKKARIISIIKDGVQQDSLIPGDEAELVLNTTCFYLEAGGQVSDTGVIQKLGKDEWRFEVQDVIKPAPGLILHKGRVVAGNPKVNDEVELMVDRSRRQDIMRNHTATHLLHSQLKKILGKHARQTGSLVAPDRLRFDFSHPDALTREELNKIEKGVNNAIHSNEPVTFDYKPIQRAIREGAEALFGEKYPEMVRTISVGDKDKISYELCGGTHVERTSDIGMFMITSEGSIASGIRRIEAVTGRKAYELYRANKLLIRQSSDLLKSTPENLPTKIESLKDELAGINQTLSTVKKDSAHDTFSNLIENITEINGVPVLIGLIPEANAGTLRGMTDIYRSKFPTGVILLGSVMESGKPLLISAVTSDLVERGLHAGQLVKISAEVIGGSGGGKATLAQAGGKDPSRLDEAFKVARKWLEDKLING